VSKSGFLFKMNDSDSFIDAITTLASMRQENREEMGKSARKDILENCTWQHRVKETLEFISD
jgi:glycosyltransferase involved in cell wall biosynthesis